MSARGGRLSATLDADTHAISVIEDKVNAKRLRFKLHFSKVFTDINKITLMDNLL